VPAREHRSTSIPHSAMLTRRRYSTCPPGEGSSRFSSILRNRRACTSSNVLDYRQLTSGQLASRAAPEGGNVPRTAAEFAGHFVGYVASRAWQIVAMLSISLAAMMVPQVPTETRALGPAVWPSVSVAVLLGRPYALRRLVLRAQRQPARMMNNDSHSVCHWDATARFFFKAWAVLPSPKVDNDGRGARVSRTARST